MVQAAGSWSVDACCAVPGNWCSRDGNSCSGKGCDYCADNASSSDWLFGLWPGPPQRFEPTGTDTSYQNVEADIWPHWGRGGDLAIGDTSHAPGGEHGACDQGYTYRGTSGEICGGSWTGWRNWGATDVEVWYPI